MEDGGLTGGKLVPSRVIPRHHYNNQPIPPKKDMIIIYNWGWQVEGRSKAGSSFQQFCIFPTSTTRSFCIFSLLQIAPFWPARPGYRMPSNGLSSPFWAPPLPHQAHHRHPPPFHLLCPYGLWPLWHLYQCRHFNYMLKMSSLLLPHCAGMQSSTSRHVIFHAASTHHIM